MIGSMKDALNLAHRFQGGELFRQYVLQRLRLVIPASLLMVATSLALAFGIVLCIGGTRPLTVFLALLIAPLVLAGSLLVQGYMFLSWLEGRALARSLGHRARGKRGKLGAWVQKRLNVDLGAAPPVPLLPAGIFLALPLLLLLLASPTLAIALIILHGLAPLAFARLDGLTRA